MPVLRKAPAVPVAPPVTLPLATKPSSRLVADSRILHSSLVPFSPALQDAEFPSFPRALGVIVRQRTTHNRVVITIEQEWPSLSSTIRGEESSRDDVETTTQEKIHELIERCHVLAIELTTHATRLEKQLRKDRLVDTTTDTDASAVKERKTTPGAQYVMSKVSEAQAPAAAPTPATPPRHKQQRRPKRSAYSIDELNAELAAELASDDADDDD